jgi:hypothetical protein
MFKFFTNIKKDKLKRYQDFIYEKLNVDLSDIIKKRNTLSKQLKDWQLGNDKHQP